MTAQILVVEDDPEQRLLLSVALRATAHQLEFADSVATAIEAVNRLQPDLILLDIGLPDGSGLDVLRAVRSTSEAYVIIVSAQVDELDRIGGLAAGADDYVCKPYSLGELEMRIEAVLRRPRDRKAPGASASAAIAIDRSRRSATAFGAPMDLTRREFDLLAMLLDHDGIVLSRRQLLDRIWGPDWFDERVVVSHLSNLRKKLDEHGMADALVTVRGVGYQFSTDGVSPA